MIEDMTGRNLSPAIQRSSVQAVAKFARFFGRSPEKLDLADVGTFQVHLVAGGMSWPALNQTVCALRFFYGVTLRQADLPERIAYARAPQTAGGAALRGSSALWFLLPARVLSRRFRDLFVARLHAAFATGELHFSDALAALVEPAAFAERSAALGSVEWIVYAKPPFAEPEAVLSYLARYTHRVAIANFRLTRLDDGEVDCTWKDYRGHGKTKLMTLAADAFLRRFLQHTVPDRFHRIRHIGFLANGHRSEKLALCRALLAVQPPKPPPLETCRDRIAG